MENIKIKWCIALLRLIDTSKQDRFTPFTFKKINFSLTLEAFDKIEIEDFVGDFQVNPFQELFPQIKP